MVPCLVTLTDLLMRQAGLSASAELLLTKLVRICLAKSKLPIIVYIISSQLILNTIKIYVNDHIGPNFVLPQCVQIFIFKQAPVQLRVNVYFVFNLYWI